MAEKIKWIALDWGTTHFRAWAMGENGQVVDEVKSVQGMGSLKPEEFEPVFVSQIEKWLADVSEPISAFACGMVGAKQGWIEAAYVSTPNSPPLSAKLVEAPTMDRRIRVFIVPGMCQNVPADVMRGEETQINGFLANMPEFDGVVCLPGTHSKWTHVQNSAINKFATHMTGELFALLSKQSVLRFSVASTSWSNDAFLEAVDFAISNPQKVGPSLFSIRPQTLLHDVPAAEAKSRLSGLLVGMELAAEQESWQQKQVALVGDLKLCGLYNEALKSLGCAPTVANGDMMTLNGLYNVFLSTQGVASHDG